MMMRRGHQKPNDWKTHILPIMLVAPIITKGVPPASVFACFYMRFVGCRSLIGQMSAARYCPSANSRRDVSREFLEAVGHEMTRKEPVY